MTLIIKGKQIGIKCMQRHSCQITFFFLIVRTLLYRTMNLRLKNKHLLPFPCFFTSFLQKIQKFCGGGFFFLIQYHYYSVTALLFPKQKHSLIQHSLNVSRSVNQCSALSIFSLEQPFKLQALFKDRPCLWKAAFPQADLSPRSY